ncbi:MAG: hypothetical protein ACD_10C00599G0002 [uncultured bacterium]|nr:MAG: hypothetical protein ACD_10C00599G0002 [uncultured bacterium]
MVTYPEQADNLRDLLRYGDEAMCPWGFVVFSISYD